MVVLVDLHAQTLHGRQHLGTDVLTIVDRVHREITAFDTRTVACVAHLVLGVGVPGRIERVDLVGDFVDGVRETHIVKQEEFRFRAEIGHVTDA